MVTTLYNFCDPLVCPDPEYLLAPLIQATNGDFYGTTPTTGGVNCAPGACGTIFKMTPSGALTTLYTFCSSSGCPNGDNSPGALVQAANGNLYAAMSDGAYGNGSIIKVTPSGVPTTLYNFCSQTHCPDGAQPNTALVQGTNGDLYGTTVEGGAGSPYCDPLPGCGTIFKITPTGTLTTLYSFCLQSGCPDGQFPVGLISAPNGDIYGTTGTGGTAANCSTSLGCGTIFKITPSGKFTTLYSFCSQGGCIDGENPSGLIQAASGNLYGTTGYGGANRYGTIFKITPTGTLTTLYSFCSQTGCPDGQSPNGLTQGTNGIFYGTTTIGGANNNGTIFAFSTGQAPFIETRPTAGAVEEKVTIIGYKLTGATSVTFNGIPAAFTVDAATEITTTVPAGATTGKIQVTTPTGTLTSNIPFEVAP